MSLHIRTSDEKLIQSPLRRRKENAQELPMRFDPSMDEYCWGVYKGDERILGPYEVLGNPKDLFGVMRNAMKQAGYEEPEAPPLATSQPQAAAARKETTKTPPDRGSVSDTSLQVPAGLEVITAEILILKRQTAQNIIEIGRRLLQAKEMVGHGNWLKYLEEKVAFSEWTARRFMRAASESNRSALTDLEPTKVYLLLEAPEDVRDDLAHKAPDMTTRQIEEVVRKANEAERRAKEAEAKAADAETRAKEAESRPPQVITETVEVKVYETPPEVQREIEQLRKSVVDKERTIEQRQKDYEKVQKMLAEASRDLEKLREHADRNGVLEAELRQKEQDLQQLSELQRRLGANFDDEGRDPKGGLRLMQALHPIDDSILTVIGDVELVKRAGAGGWCDDQRVKELSDRLKQLATLLDAILADRDKRPITAEFREVD